MIRKNKTWIQFFVLSLLSVTALGALSILSGIQSAHSASAASLPLQTEYAISQNYARHDLLTLLQASNAITIYLPIVHKNPTPVPPLFYDDFSNPNTKWFTGPQGNCYFSYINGRYKVELKASNLECWGAGPAKTQVKYGLFETLAFSDNNSNTAYGFYLNGKGGGEQYLFMVKPNDSGCSNDKGKYEFYRTQSGNRVKKLEGCNTAVKRGSGSGASNLLQVRHTSNGILSIYVNGTLLGTYTDSKQLTGTGTGTYSRSGSGQNVVRYEYFAIYNP